MAMCIDLIENNVKDKCIKGILTKAYKFYEEERTFGNIGYQSEIMKRLFPKSKFKNKIDDNLINKTKHLLVKYEDHIIYNDPLKRIDIDKEIEEITSDIRKLDLN